ncbi:Suppressor of tumorigenicity 7 protein-like [Actinidia chinensis var. chinensis]|uniref:Suppressor of tumorigenicity 7 protein-like n=1 Tax=Actinidia chinensis var. chinensis TaxID=1590841 RepID=A0A2R6RL09_ACTCC|nr:Suppressor of tumorigenicity 7 protein-like [Actinidia chinensis var. chinensis]
MEKVMRPYDKEYMKMAMLKHEETFKQQVYELHRLYQIQKIMMKRTDHNRPKRQNQERWNSPNHHQKPLRGLDLEQPADEYIQESDGDGELELEDDEREIELTLGPSSYYRRKKVETPPSSVSGPSFSSSSTGSSHMMMRTTNSGVQSARKESFGVEEKLRLLQNPWLFQALGLNMT